MLQTDVVVHQTDVVVHQTAVVVHQTRMWMLQTHVDVAEACGCCRRMLWSIKHGCCSPSNTDVDVADACGFCRRMLGSPSEESIRQRLCTDDVVVL